MSNWKVSKEVIEVFPHNNADTLMLGKVGSYQVVFRKGDFNDGDVVVFAPEKSILTGRLRDEFDKYLVGPDKNRIKAVRLRDEVSSGVILPNWVTEMVEDAPLGEDISNLLEITLYEPPIPLSMSGKVSSFSMPFVVSHDCEHVGVYVNELVQGERVVISEKVHGTQINLAIDLSTDKIIVSSKGLFKKGLVLQEAADNLYWKAVTNDDLLDKVKRNFNDGIVQIIGEVVPAQSGYTYGFKKPTIKIFVLKHNGINLQYDEVPNDFASMWVPILYDGSINLIEKSIVFFEDKSRDILKTKIVKSLPEEVIKLSVGMEMVSGTELHIREGAVISPYIDRCAIDGTKLKLKLINPAYKETGEELS